MWTCPFCNEQHDELPTVYGAEAPWRALGVTEADSEARVELNKDLCVVDEKHFFVRGHIELAVDGKEAGFAWSVWCSLSQESFSRMMDSWESEDRDQDPPYFGWLMTDLPLYPTTLHLKTNVRNRKPGQVPFVELEPTEHPLAVEQQTGITQRRVEEIAHALLGHNTR